MPSPHAFLVNGLPFYDPHPGAQLEIVQRVARRVMTGEGPSKYFLRGNRGGGKSFTIRRGVCHALAMMIPGLKYVVVRRNYPDLESNHLIYVGSEMRTLGGDFNETKRIARYHNGSIGFYRQCEEFADVEKIVGAEAALLFVDEAPQIGWDNQALMLPSLRVPKVNGRQPYYAAAVFSGNPTGESIEELDKHFVEQDVSKTEEPSYDPADWCHVPVFLKDNPSVDPDEYLKQLGSIPPAFRAAWIDGVRMDSRSLFQVQKEKDGKPYHYIHELPTVDGVPLLRVPWIQIYRAFDMGFFPDPAVCVWFAVVGRRIIAVHEETWFQTIAKDLAAKILETTKELIGDTPCGMTYADPQIDFRTGADVTVKDILEMHGVPIECSINDRVLYADTIHGLLGEEVEPGVPRFQIYEPGCPMLAKYLPKMRWDEKNPRKMADHKFDHWPICLAYFGISSGVLSHTTQETSTTRPVWMDWLDEERAGGHGSRRRAV
jgi:hypothetical protein